MKSFTRPNEVCECESKCMRINQKYGNEMGVQNGARRGKKGRGADLILALFITHRSLKDTEDWRDRQDRTKNAREIGWKEESREREREIGQR